MQLFSTWGEDNSLFKLGYMACKPQAYSSVLKPEYVVSLVKLLKHRDMAIPMPKAMPPEILILLLSWGPRHW